MSSNAPTHAEKVLDYIAVTDAGMQKAAAQLKVHEERQVKVASLIPKVIDALVANNRLTDTPERRQKVAEFLNNPASALEFMIKLAEHRNTDEQSHIGSPVASVDQVKTAAAKSLTSPHVGARTTQVKQSTVNLFTAMGMSAPQEG